MQSKPQRAKQTDSWTDLSKAQCGSSLLTATLHLCCKEETQAPSKSSTNIPLPQSAHPGAGKATEETNVGRTA